MKSRWKIVLSILGACAVSVLSLWVWTERVAAHKWAALENSVQSWIVEAKYRDARRPALLGDPIPGNAWDDYELALQEVRKIGLWFELRDFIERRKGADRKTAQAIVAAHDSVLVPWSRGLRRTESRYPRNWETLQIYDLRDEFRLSEIAACKARFLLEERRVSEAADLLLGVGLFARDVGHNCFGYQKPWSLHLVEYALEGFKDILLSGRAAKADLERIARGLEMLDLSFDREGLEFLNERIRVGLAFLRVGPTAALPPLCLSKASWRYAFSSRFMAVDAVQLFARGSARLAAAESMLRVDELKVRREVEENWAASRNPLVVDLKASPWSSQRFALVRLRLLRMASHYLATGEILSLDDPFGATLLHSSSGGTLKVWSVSINGIDDSGTGHWKLSGYGGRMPDDIVFEIGP